MAKLTHEQKVFVVRSYACFRTEGQIEREMKELWPGLVLAHCQVQAYNPECAKGRATSKDEFMMAQFNEARKQYLSDIGSVKFANQRCRLEELSNSVEKSSIQDKLAIFRHIARETGGMYEKERGSSLTISHENLDPSVKDNIVKAIMVASLNIGKTEEEKAEETDEVDDQDDQDDSDDDTEGDAE